MHYHVGSNVPGYLPESDVRCVDTPGDAWMAFHDDLTRALDSDAIPHGDFLEMDTARNLITEADIERSGGATFDVHDGRPLPVRYWIERMGTPRSECELAEEDED